ncbi:DUF397 domain-containing protein [Amycolatopsis anabasis]|uniref:DUF397 domain-containing protein n=1 Tax=Amycolatopsis anabasis TaxID=1840409 RepID=UPI00131DA21F|nr:DUF397 domain-containing protein [Amycolatopsis anabasis]
MGNRYAALGGWRKSTRSHYEENACVEVGFGSGLVGIRDTKQADLPEAARPVLVTGAATFAALVAHLRIHG